jgi:UDP-N-acetyl-D-mannosaminuronate dehydrogenase
LKQQTLFIDDSWVLSRARGYSKSFREFLLGIAPQLAEKDRKEVEKAAEILGPKGMDQLEMPAWIKPFATKITQQVSQKITAELPKIAAQLFRAGIFSLSNALYDVAKERGVRNESVLRLIKMLPEFETLMYFLNVRKYLCPAGDEVID